MSELPAYESRRLQRSPLSLVAWQLNCEEVGREITHAQARDVQRVLGDRWTQLQSAQRVTTTVTPGGAINEPNRQAYRLLSTDSAWSILLNPDSVTLETRKYTVWSEMHPIIQKCLEAITTVYDPLTETRVGLRYVDQIALPDTAESWDGLIPNALLGVSADKRIGASVLASDQRVLLQVTEDVRCLLRHGLQASPEGVLGQSYLLDFDLSREGTRSFDRTGVSDLTDILHDWMGRLFTISLTQDLYEWLKG